MPGLIPRQLLARLGHRQNLATGHTGRNGPLCYSARCQTACAPRAFARGEVMQIEDSSDGSGMERIAAFSDGVIAIIITIMVLELKLPEAAASGELWSNFLAPLAPKLLVYALSFVIVGAHWVNHHLLLAVVRRATPQLMWLNLLLLFFLSLIPLATS